MPDLFRIECVTPSGVLFTREAHVVSAVSDEGSFGIMAHHQPLLAVLKDPSDVVIRTGEKSAVFRVTEGILRVEKTRVLLLASDVSEVR